MNKLRKALVAVASVAMVAGTMGLGAVAASASSTTTSCVSRAQFIYQFDVAAGITPVYPATPDFSDVSSSSPYYGYVEAAYKAGLVNGTGGGMFSPNACLTRDQVVKIEIIALGDQSAALKDATTSTSFTDDSSIPSWARGYIVEAVSLGLVKGYPNGSFQPGLELSSSIAGDFIAQYQAAGKTAAFSVSASSTDVAPGAAVTLSTSGAVGTVSYSTTSGAVISGNTFVGSTPGTYTVTATSTTGQSATVKIGVYGAAAALVINAPSSVVANGASSETVTVDVVDANGNIVAGDNSSTVTLKVNGSTNGNVLTGASSDTALDTNGVATFNYTAGTVPGATDSLVATSGNLTQATASVTATAQVATSLSVSAPSYVEANNSSGSGTVSVEVDDQTGNPMISGTYGVSLSLSGPATFAADGTTGPESGAYVGGITPTDATFTFNSVQSETGAITFTASATGLASATATTTAVIAGSPVAIQLTAPSTTSFAESATSTGIEYTYQVVDSHGYPVGYATEPTVTVLNSAGTAAANISVTQTYDSTTGAGTVTVNQKSGNNGAGTYTIQLSDGASVLTSSATDTFTETAGAPTQVVVSAAASAVPASNPSTTITAQLEDAFGNAASDPGVVVTFFNPPSTPDSTGTSPNPYTLTLSASQATTGSDGSASITVTAPPYTGQHYNVEASAPIGTNGAAVLGTTYVSSTNAFTVDSTVATNLSVSIKDTQSGSTYDGSLGIAGAGDSELVTITATDQYGNAAGAGDTVNVTFSGAGAFENKTAGVGSTLPTPDLSASSGTAVTANSDGSWTVTLGSNGTALIDATAYTSGSISASAQDISSSSAPKGSATVAVQAGTPTQYGLFNSSGTNVSGNLTVSANTPVELWVKPMDAEGNATVETTTTTVALTPGTNGAFRLSPSGSDISAVTLNAGSTQTAVYYVNSGAAPYTGLSAAADTASSVLAANGTTSQALTSGTAGTAQALTFTVKDSAGNLVAGATVTVTLVSSGTYSSADGTISATSGGTPGTTATVTTNASGVATVYYTPGTNYLSGGATTDTITGTSNSKAASYTYTY